MANRHSPKLSSNGRYRVVIGSRRFWLPKDVQTATKITNALDLAWDNETNKDAEGKKCWSDKSIAWAFNGCGIKPPVSEPSVQPPAAPTQPKGVMRPAFQSRDITFHQALDLYVKMRLADQTLRRAGEDSEVNVGSIKHNLPDQPLHQIDAAAQQTMRETFLALPPNRNNGEPISPITAKKWLQELGGAFEYFSHPDSRIGWIPPYPKWREKFALNETAIKAVAKNAGDKDFGKIKPTFDLSQLAILYKAATPRERLYLLGGVCLGWTATEFATLKRDQIQTDENGEMFIVDKERSKTGVPMSFWVCPELAALIKNSVAHTPPNSDDLAFMTRNRQGKPFPLVHGKTDTVAQSWERVIYRLNKIHQQVPPYPHSRLRKLAGQLIKNITGNHDLTRMILSHKLKDVASTNYVGIGVNVGVGKSPLERLWEAQREVHKALAPIFASVKNAPKEQSKAA